MRWHTADFDALDWHGVHVHGWRIVERGPGEADLMLDIDWILERPPAGPGGGATRLSADGHVLAQAMLVFHDVAGLRFVLDFAACSAASGPFSIEGVHRGPLAAGAGGAQEADDAWPENDDEAGLAAYGSHREDEAEELAEDYGPWRWRIDLAWPEGELVFEASGFSQWLVGEPQTLDASVLPATLRS